MTTMSRQLSRAEMATTDTTNTTDTGFDFEVAVVGLGYVGLPTALSCHAAGQRVLGVEISEERLATISDERADLLDTDRVRLAHAVTTPDFEMTTDVSRLRTAAAVIVCVPTPVDQDLLPDLEPLRSACASLVEHAVPGQVLMLTSTSYVGSTNDLVVGPLTRRGLRVGVDVFVAFSPERIDPGNDRFAHEDVARVTGGSTPECTRRAAALLARYTRNVHTVESIEVAEMTKLVENTFRAVNIALANEFAEICRTLGLDVMNVIDAAATKPYGFMPFYPGPGVGGHCIPCDPHYLLWQLRERRLSTPVIAQSMGAIAARPSLVVDRVRQLLSERGCALGAARVLVVGVAYKPDVEDLRESPALEILQALEAYGVKVAYYDPHFTAIVLPDGGELKGIDDPLSFGADLVVVHSAHTDVELDWLARVPAVLDTTYRLPKLPQTVQL